MRTAQCIATQVLGLLGDGHVHCPECARPLGEANAAGLVAAVDACEPTGTRRRPDFGAGPEAQRQRR